MKGLRLKEAPMGSGRRIPARTGEAKRLTIARMARQTRELGTGRAGSGVVNYWLALDWGVSSSTGTRCGWFAQLGRMGENRTRTSTN